MKSNGMLAIWSDIAAERETDYLHWLAREHTSERLGTPGFNAVRVFRAMLPDVRRYFICYDLEAPNVVDSAEYLAKLDNPSPWSQRIMPLLGNFRRGGGAIRANAGVGQGALVAALLLQTQFPERPGPMAAELARQDGIVAVRILETDIARTSVTTREKSMRKADESFAGLVLIEGMRDADVVAARKRFSALYPNLVSSGPGPAPLYQLVFSL